MNYKKKKQPGSTIAKKNLGKRKQNEEDEEFTQRLTRHQANSMALVLAPPPPRDKSNRKVSYKLTRKYERKSKPTKNITRKKRESSTSETDQSEQHTSQDSPELCTEMDVTLLGRSSARHMEPDKKIDIRKDYTSISDSSSSSSSERLPEKKSRYLSNFVDDGTTASSKQVFLQPRNNCNMLAVKEVNAATSKSFVSNTYSRKQAGVKVARDKSNVVEEQTRDSEEARCQAIVVVEQSRDRFSNLQEMGENHVKSCNFGLTEVVNMCTDVSSEEVESTSSAVSVLGYKVKKAAIPMLKSILQKHGDIAIDCTATTLAGRSSFLEKICEIMQTLQATKFVDLEESNIKDLLDIVEDYEKLKLKVGWLKNRLEEILELKKVIKDYAKLKEATAAKSKSMEKSEKAVQRYDFEIGEQLKRIDEYEAKKLQCLTEIQELEKKMCLELENVKASKAESESIMEKISCSEANAELFIKSSMIHDLV